MRRSSGPTSSIARCSADDSTPNAPTDRSRGANPDHAVFDIDVAVRLTGMIYVSRDIAADACVDDRPVRQLEAPDVAAPDVAPLALETLPVGNLLACVMDDARVLRDRFRRVHAPSVDSRSPPFNHVP